MIRRWALWPLYSPRRLAVTVVAALALLALIGSARGSGSHGRTLVPTRVEVTSPTPTLLPARATNTTLPGQLGTAKTATTPASGAAMTPSPAPASTLPPEAVSVATAWVSAWASHSQQPGWAQALAATSTSQLAQLLQTVEPANVPATKVTSQATVSMGDQGGGAVQVATDAGVVVVTVTADGKGGFLVADVGPLPKG